MIPLGSMEKSACCSCLKTNATLQCGICEDSVCKGCARFLDESSFSFLMEIPKNLSHSTYCYSCFDQNVASELASYNQCVEKAKDIIIFEKSQSKETRNFKRHERPYQITDCADRDECDRARHDEEHDAAERAFHARLDVRSDRVAARARHLGQLCRRHGHAEQAHG